MEKVRFIYDPRKQVMMVYQGDHCLGGYIGQIAERKLHRLLLTDSVIELGEFLTAREKQQRQQKKQSLNS